MRAIAVLVIAPLRAACFSIGGECHPIRLAAGRDHALSCAEAYAHGSTTYIPWCAGVRPGSLGEALARHAGTSERVVIRQIDGIEPARAVALRLIPRRNGGCGTWRFAPATSLDGSEAKDLAREVVLPRYRARL